jgi:uncharacterized protein (DUF697 family)
MAQADDEAFLKKYGGYKPQPTTVPVTQIKPILGGETPEEAAARRAGEGRAESEEQRRRREAQLKEQDVIFRQEQEQRNIEERTFQRGSKIADQYYSRKPVQIFEAAWPAFTSAISQPNTTSGDRARIYNAIKVFDPDGAVPTGDIEGIESQSPIVQRIVRQFGRALDQGGTLPEQQRRELHEALDQRVKTLRGPYDLIRRDFETRLQRNNLDPLEIGSPIYQADADIYENYLQSLKAPPAEGQPKGVPVLQVAEGDRFSTDEDIEIASKLQGAWLAGQTIEQVNELSRQLTGGNELSQETIQALNEDAASAIKNNTRRQIRFTPNRSGIREGAGPGRGSAAAAAAVRGFTANLGEEALAQFSPESAAKLQAAGEFANERYPITSFAAETASSLFSPVNKVLKFLPGGPTTREVVEGVLGGAGEARPDANLSERALLAATGGGTSAVLGSLGRRFLPGGETPQGDMLPEDEMINVPTGGAEMPPAGMAPPAGGMAPPTAGMAPPTGAAPDVGIADEALDVGREEMIALARKAVSRTPGASKAREELAELAKIDPEAQAAAERLGIELPVDILSQNAQLQRVTGLERSQIGSEAETAWRKTYDAAAERAYEAMDELNAVTDISQLSANVFNRLDAATQGLENQADALRKEVTAAIDDAGRVDASNIRAYFENEIRRLGGGKEGLSGLSAEEKKLYAMVSKGNPTYTALDRKRAEIGRAMTKGKGAWVDSNEQRLNDIYAKLADDQMGFIESSAGKEIADKQRAANTLFKQMYDGRKQMQEIFGRNLSKDLGPVITQAITQGGKGGMEAINKLLTNVPQDMHGTVLTSGLFQTATGPDRRFSFTNFSNTYDNLRKNNLVFKEFAKAIGPDGVNLLNDFYAISRRLSDASENIIRTGASTQLNLLNAESLLGKIAKGVGGAAAAGAATSMLGGDLLTTIIPVVAGAAGPELAQRFAGKTNAEKLHALMKSDKFRDLAVSAATGEGVDANVNRVAGSKEFRDYAKLAGIDMKDARNWLISGITKAGTIGATEVAGVTPMEAPGVEMPQ